MDHGAHTGGTSNDESCKVSMLWNWYTIDACFISESWHIRSLGAFAGTIFGIFFLVLAIEGFRRGAREYDRKIVKDHEERQRAILAIANKGGSEVVAKSFRPSATQQATRAALYAVQFGAGYMLMLLAMYYNGYVILTIFFGAFVGFFVSSWDTVGDITPPEETGQCCC